MTAPDPTLQDLLRTATRTLSDAGLDSPRLDAEVMLRHLLGVDRTGLFLRLPDATPEDVRAPYDALIARRMEGESVAYIVGEREFMGLPFIVDPSVLVPRPETELLVEWALEWLGEHPDSAVIDVGTGSGAIALSIAAMLPASSRAMVIASDPSIEALRIAIRNRQSLSDRGIVAKVVFVQQSLLTETTGEVDLVLANLPYLTPAQIAENPDLAVEPRLALDGGNDGLDLVRMLIADLPRILAPGGAAGFELDPSQTDTVTRLLAAQFPNATIRTIADLAGLPRHVVLSHEEGNDSHHARTTERSNLSCSGRPRSCGRCRPSSEAPYCRIPVARQGTVIPAAAPERARGPRGGSCGHARFPVVHRRVQSPDAHTCPFLRQGLYGHAGVSPPLEEGIHVGCEQLPPHDLWSRSE